MAFSDILNPVFDPLLNLHPGLSIFIVAFVITFLITIVYKYTTNQKRMKELKDGLKEGQTKARELSKKDPKKAMEMQSKLMSQNMEYMKHSFKSTLYTLIPVLIIFAWMSGNLAYYPLAPGQEFTVTAEFAAGHASFVNLSSMPDLKFISDQNQEIKYDSATKKEIAVWRVSGDAGEYKITLNYNGESYDHQLLITPGKKYFAPEKIIADSKLKKITVGNEKVYPFNIFGLKFTWFWAYLILSIGLSITLRKIMKVY